MRSIDTLDLKSFVDTAVRDVFDTMLSMGVKGISPDSAAQLEKPLIVGTVGLSGLVLGNVHLRLPHRFAVQIAAAMLGMGPGEIGGEEDVHDVIGEVCNMVGGNLKSRLCDLGFNCQLTIPTITTGGDFRIEPRGWQRHERFGFRNCDHSALVEIFLKQGLT